LAQSARNLISKTYFVISGVLDVCINDASFLQLRLQFTQIGFARLATNKMNASRWNIPDVASLAAIEKFQRASAERDQLMSDLQVAQKSSRWELTAGCTSNRSHGASKDFCDRVDETRNGIRGANVALSGDFYWKTVSPLYLLSVFYFRAVSQLTTSF
jgi:hypothetical protein